MSGGVGVVGGAAQRKAVYQGTHRSSRSGSRSATTASSASGSRSILAALGRETEQDKGAGVFGIFCFNPGRATFVFSFARARARAQGARRGAGGGATGSE